MKIATSSASFSTAFASGKLTQLEWLDICANELEVDGVVFDARDFPRDDAEYLAQLKKVAVDLGLCVAALDIGMKYDIERQLGVATALGAPLVILQAPAASGGPAEWGKFAALVKRGAAEAKRVNVTLALRAVAETLCAGVADCKQLAKEVDSAWLRFALAPDELQGAGEPAPLLHKAVIAVHRIGDLDGFATSGDPEAERVIGSLARFRGFVVLEHGATASLRTSYHAAVARFTDRRAQALALNA